MCDQTKESRRANDSNSFSDTVGVHHSLDSGGSHGANASGRTKEVSQSVTHYCELDSELEHPTDKTAALGGVSRPLSLWSIFTNIDFRYPTRPGIYVLCGISLEVEPGTYITLVGATGSVRVPCEIETFALHFSLMAFIQLIEKFDDPLAEDIYVSNSNFGRIHWQ